MGFLLLCLLGYVMAQTITVRCGAGCAPKISYTVTVNGTTSENPTLQLTRNQTYIFDVVALNNPFAIHTLPGVIATNARFVSNSSNTSVLNQGVITGVLTLTVPADAPNQLFYQSETNFAMFGRLDIVPFLTQPDVAPTPTPTTAPSSIFDWKPRCDPFLRSGEVGTTIDGTTQTSFTIPLTSGFGRRDTAPPSNPEIIFGSPVTDPPLATSTAGGGASTSAPGPQSGSGRSYRCLTTTRAEQLVQMSLFYFTLEGTNPSDLCNKPTDGPGIFAPLHSARWFMATQVAMFNGWAIYDRDATPIGCNNPPPKRSSVRQRTIANKEISMTHSFFEVASYILPKRRTIFAKALFDAYGLDVENPSTQAGVDGRAVGLDFIQSFLSVDRSNQENCYADTTGWVRVNQPVLLNNYSTVKASFESRANPLIWGDVRWDGVVPARRYLTPHAGKWRRIVYTPEEAELLIPTTNPLPSNEQLRREMDFLVDVQRELDNDSGRKRLQAHFWADGPRTTLPPGHMMEVITDAIPRAKRFNLDQATRMYVLAGVAVYEAGVQAWTLKRQYQSIRPGEYIPMFRINDTLRHQYVGPYCPNEDIPGWRWIPYQFLPLNTPPFPEYPSGHSSFSSAVMSVMALFTGSDTLPKPLSYPYKAGALQYKFGTEPHCFQNGTTFDGSRCTYVVCSKNANFSSANNFSPSADGDIGPFYTFSSVALSAGYSRLYGGIHPLSGNLGGLSVGTTAGRRVWEVLCSRHLGQGGCLSGLRIGSMSSILTPLFSVLALLLILF